MKNDLSFLANLQQEQEGLVENPATEKEKETPSVPPTENKPEEETAPSAEDKGKDEPESKPDAKPEVFHAFHEHPRWRQMQRELEELRAFRETATPLLEKVGQAPTREERQSEKIPDWFSTLFGNNEQAWQQYKDYTLAERQALRAEVLSEIREEEAQKTKVQKQMDDWVETELQNLADSGKRFNRNELLNFTLKYLPTDEDGNISLSRALELMEATGKTKEPQASPAEAKKKIADKTMAKGNAREEARDYKTFADFRGMSFTDIPGRE